MAIRYAGLRRVFRACVWWRGRAMRLVNLWGRGGFNDDLSFRSGFYAAYDRLMHGALGLLLIGPVAIVQEAILSWVWRRLSIREQRAWHDGLFS
jgi:hypothetical protein